MCLLVMLLMLFLWPALCTCLPEKSIWSWRIQSVAIMDMQKSMLSASEVFAQIYCKKDSVLSVTWILVQSSCIEMFVGLNASVFVNKLEDKLAFPKATSYKSRTSYLHCIAGTTQFLEGSDQILWVPNTSTQKKNSTESSVAQKNTPQVQGLITKVWADGAHLLALKVRCAKPVCDLDIDVRVEMRNADGSYLSAVEYPFLPFNGLMSFLYFCFVVLWLILTITYWHTLMRIQFCIGIVLILGLWEHLGLTAIYGTLQNSGTVSPSAAYFTELIACFKRTLARLLVLIACLGYGVTKPRLGQIWFQRCLIIGSVYFILVTMEGMARVHYPRFHTTQFILLTLLPLMCLDAAIMWWIFIYLARTLRETRVRHNVVKHRLYRNFSYVLVVVSLVSVIFMVWSVMVFKRRFCIESWRFLWIDDAFWQALFLLVLGVIIVLWRPTASNQEYAYSLLDVPTVNEDGEEDEEVLLEQLGHENSDSSDVRTRTPGDIDLTSQAQVPSTQKQANTLRLIPPGIQPSIVERIGIEAASGPGEQQPVWKVD